MKNSNDKSKAFLDYTREIATSFVQRTPDEVVIVHHNDCDGLSSGHILAMAIARLGIPYRTLCLEKPFPQVMEGLLTHKNLALNTVFIFADFASGMLDTLRELNVKNFPIFILDHHTISSATTEFEHLYILNCREFEIDGNRECSASSVCFQFALCLDSLNSNLAEFALLGAIGDGQLTEDGNLIGLNAHSLRYISPEPTASDYCLPSFRCAAKKIADALDALGSFGYLEGGPERALNGLALGLNKAFWQEAQGFRNSFENELTHFLDSLELHTTQNLQWFSLGNSFKGMGVKTVGLVCEALFLHGRADPQKYLAGFQKIPDLIPSIGTLPPLGVKVSMRVVPPLRTSIEHGDSKPLNVILPQATKIVGGFSDACHLHAAAVTIPEGRELELIDEINKLMG